MGGEVVKVIRNFPENANWYTSCSATCFGQAKSTFFSICWNRIRASLFDTFILLFSANALSQAIHSLCEGQPRTISGTPRSACLHAAGISIGLRSPLLCESGYSAVIARDETFARRVPRMWRHLSVVQFRPTSHGVHLQCTTFKEQVALRMPQLTTSAYDGGNSRWVFQLLSLFRLRSSILGTALQLRWQHPLYRWEFARTSS